MIKSALYTHTGPVAAAVMYDIRNELDPAAGAYHAVYMAARGAKRPMDQARAIAGRYVASLNI